MPFPTAKKQQFGWVCCVPPQPALLPGCLVCTWQQAPTASAYLDKNTPYLYKSTFQITYLSFFQLREAEGLFCKEGILQPFINGEARRLERGSGGDRSSRDMRLSTLLDRAQFDTEVAPKKKKKKRCAQRRAQRSPPCNAINGKEDTLLAGSKQTPILNLF